MSENIINDDYNPDIITLSDDDGNEFTFEVLDAIETDDARYLAMLPQYDDPKKMLDDSGELVIVKVEEENGETYLCPIENDEEFNEVGEAFEERLAEMFDFEEE